MFASSGRVQTAVQEPLLLTGAFFAFFCALMLYVRCNFALLPADKTKVA